MSVCSRLICCTQHISLKQAETYSRDGGAERDRTVDPLLAKQVLSQLSYSPIDPAQERGKEVVGLGRFELPTSPLSGVRSNQLSYRPGKTLPPKLKRSCCSVASPEGLAVSTLEKVSRTQLNMLGSYASIYRRSRQVQKRDGLVQALCGDQLSPVPQRSLAS